MKNRKNRLKRIPSKSSPGVSCLFFRLVPKREKKRDHTVAIDPSSTKTGKKGKIQ
jgi:hypothetical protein